MVQYIMLQFQEIIMIRNICIIYMMLFVLPTYIIAVGDQQENNASEIRITTHCTPRENVLYQYATCNGNYYGKLYKDVIYLEARDHIGQTIRDRMIERNNHIRTLKHRSFPTYKKIRSHAQQPDGYNPEIIKLNNETTHNETAHIDHALKYLGF